MICARPNGRSRTSIFPLSNKSLLGRIFMEPFAYPAQRLILSPGEESVKTPPMQNPGADQRTRSTVATSRSGGAAHKSRIMRPAQLRLEGTGLPNPSRLRAPAGRIRAPRKRLATQPKHSRMNSAQFYASWLKWMKTKFTRIQQPLQWMSRPDRRPRCLPYRTSLPDWVIKEYNEAPNPTLC